MLYLLTLFLCIQEAVPQAPVDENTIKFQSHPAGTQISLGSFDITVPEGVYYAGEDSVHHMFPLAGADYIPNCVGIFFSAESDWTFCLVVQHHPYQPFVLEPRPEPSVFVEQFTRQHLYRMQPFEGTATVFEPPIYDDTANSFAVAMHYVDARERWDVSGIFKKKLWVTQQDALVISLKASDEAYAKHEAAIEAVFQAVVVKETSGESLIGAKPFSYLELLGASPEPFLAPEGASLSPMVVLTSVGLAVFAIALLVFAVKKMKRQNQTADE